MPIANISGTAKLIRGTTQGRLRVVATGEHEFTIFRQDEQGKTGVAIVQASEQTTIVKILDSTVTVIR